MTGASLLERFSSACVDSATQHAITLSESSEQSEIYFWHESAGMASPSQISVSECESESYLHCKNQNYALSPKFQPILSPDGILLLGEPSLRTQLSEFLGKSVCFESVLQTAAFPSKLFMFGQRDVQSSTLALGSHPHLWKFDVGKDSPRDCWNCGKTGHVASERRQPRRVQQVQHGDQSSVAASTNPNHPLSF